MCLMNIEGQHLYTLNKQLNYNNTICSCTNHNLDNQP